MLVKTDTENTPEYSPINSDTPSPPPVNYKRNIITITVFIVGVGQIIIAILPQSAATYVESYLLESNTGFASTISIASTIGKVCLLTQLSLDVLKAITPAIFDKLLNKDWWNGLYSSRQNIHWKTKEISVIFLKVLNAMIGIFPGITFGFLTYLAFDDFAKLIQISQADAFINFLAKAADIKIIRMICVISSFNCNLYASPSVNYIAIDIGRALLTEMKTLDSIYKKRKFYFSTAIGCALVVTTCYGFKNIYQLSHEIGLTYLDMSDSSASVFGGINFGFIAMLGFITAFPLGKCVVEFLFDLIACRNNFPSKATVIINSLLITLALLICSISGLSTVWQARHENEDVVDVAFAEAASAETEILGTYSILLLLINYLPDLIAHLIDNCRPTFSHHYDRFFQRRAITSVLEIVEVEENTKTVNSDERTALLFHVK